MQRLLILILSLTLVVVVFAADVTKSTLKVEGMTCDTCVEKITTELQKVDGVKKVTVDLEAGQATIEHEDASFASLSSAIVKAGFTSSTDESKKFELDEKEGKSCSEYERSKCAKPCSEKKKEI